MIGAVQGAMQGGWYYSGYAGSATQRGSTPSMAQAARPQDGAAPSGAMPPGATPAGAAEKDGKSGVQKPNEKKECQTCENRTYTDGSNDPGVSMKTPTKVDPRGAAMAVMAHEREHVTRNDIKAKAEGREVISSTVTLHSGICGECGKPYIAGGTTRTVTAAKQSSTKQQQQPEQPRRALDMRI